MIDKTPYVFISYSWTSPEYQQRIIEIASRLMHDGIQVKLDVWDLKDGQDKHVYMEQCVNDETIDRVLIFSDRKYAEKANDRIGGVGEEAMIISSEMYSNASQQKFIPIVMERDSKGEACLPIYMNSRMYRDFTGEKYESEYKELVRTIFEKPLFQKPQVGTPPKWLTEEIPDSLFEIKTFHRDVNGSSFLSLNSVDLKDYAYRYADAIKKYYKKNPSRDDFLVTFSSLKDYRDIFLDNLKSFYSSKDFGLKLADVFEVLHNQLCNITAINPSLREWGSFDFDIFRIHIWELFICTVVFLLHYGLYDDINKLLIHTYFLNASEYGESPEPFYYTAFFFRSSFLEEEIKPHLGDDKNRLYSLAGHYLCKEREYWPIFTGPKIAEADLFLYQVFLGLDLPGVDEWGCWFPTCYVYSNLNSSLWSKLKSKQHCYELMPIFGIKTIDEFKERLKKSTPSQPASYARSMRAKLISDYVRLDDIASLP